MFNFYVDHSLDQSESHIWHVDRKWNTVEYFSLTEWRRYQSVALSRWRHCRANVAVPWNGSEGSPPDLEREGGMEPHLYRAETFISVPSDTWSEQARSRGKKSSYNVLPGPTAKDLHIRVTTKGWVSFTGLSSPCVCHCEWRHSCTFASKYCVVMYASCNKVRRGEILRNPKIFRAILCQDVTEIFCCHL